MWARRNALCEQEATFTMPHGYVGQPLSRHPHISKTIARLHQMPVCSSRTPTNALAAPVD
jgi:hypothetical protein